MRRALPSLLALSLLTAPTVLLAQDSGRLQAVRDEVHAETKDDKPCKSHNSGCNDDDNGLGELWGALFLLPWSLPHAALADNFKDDSFFLRYPYADGDRGSMCIDHYEAEHAPAQPQPHDPKGWLARVTLDESNDFHGLNRVHTQVLFDTRCRLGLQTEWFWLHEQLPCGCTDDLWLGDVTLVFRFAQNEWMQMRTGLGLRMLFDQREADFGFNFTYGAEIYPMKPLVTSLVFDAGTVGNATLLHGRATVGANWQSWELFAGYDWLRIGKVDLSGPVVGLRMWF